MVSAKSQMGKEPHDYGASLSSIREAHRRIEPFIHKTPVLTSTSLDTEVGKKLYFKCETFQKGGSFKFRGACNAVYSLTKEECQQGVVTHSSGNHAAALSLASQLRGIEAHVVVPENAPKCKVANVVRYGGTVHHCRSTLDSRLETVARIQKETSAVYIPPFDDHRILSGQGTLAVEFLEQVPLLDAIVAPISGGGLIGGIAIAAKALKPGIKVIAAEPKGADDAFQSKKQNRLIKCANPITIADGLRASMGSLTWPIVRDMVDDVITVEEEEIIHAMKTSYERLKVVVEPSGAASLAAVQTKQFRESLPDCKHIGIVLSGGNLDLDVLWAAMNHKIP